MGISILAWLSSLDLYWPETESRANMGLGMITRPIWKCPCIYYRFSIYMVTLRNLSTVKVRSHDVRFFSKAIRKENSAWKIVSCDHTFRIKLNFEKLKMCCFEINYLLYLENWAIILVELIQMCFTSDIHIRSEVIFLYQKLYVVSSICEMLRFCNSNRNDFGLPI